MSEPLTAKTIRLYCDGELPDEQALQVEQRLQQDPDLRSQVETERRLKEAVVRVLRADGAPAGLVERARDVGAEETGAVVGRTDVEPKPATASRAWWRGPIRANFFAVAACLVLVIGAVLFGIFGPPIDSLQVRGVTDVAAEAAAAVAGEHVMTTADLPTIAAGMPYHTRDDAELGLAQLVGAAGRTFDLSDLGYAFVAGSACDVPHCARGSHLIYYRSEGVRGLVTLHIVPDRGQLQVGDNPFPGSLPFETDIVPEGPSCQKDVLVWNHEGLSYLLVVCVDDDVQPVAARMQEALQAAGPAPRR
ncbi:MAG: anti-sigma factor family protein [Planctomycetota bacterium]|jgi:anti-sigma factor RsiW